MPTSTAPPPTQSAPPPDTQPPGPPNHLRAATNVPGVITLRWALPHAPDLAGIVVRRGRGRACPASSAAGIPVGGTAPRAEQKDTSEVDTRTYCYAVFAYDSSGNTSAAAVAHAVRNPGDITPPPPVAHLTAGLTAAHHVELRWVTPVRAGIRAVVVRRGVGSACPAGRKSGTGVGDRLPRRSQVDLAAKPGKTACYRVYAIDAAGNVSVAASVTIAVPAAVAAGAGAADPPSRSSGGWLASVLVRAVAAAGLVMLLLASAAALLVRRRPASAYAPARTGGARQAPAGYSPAALVIPALVAVALVVVTVFLLNP